MKKHDEQLAAIEEMRNLMDRATRFRSISGLSAMVAGLLAIICVAFISQFTGIRFFEAEAFDRMLQGDAAREVQLSFFFLLITSIGFGIYLAARNAHAKGQDAWDSAAKRLAFHMAIPLVAGGIFSILISQQGLAGLVPPITLLFYGLALFNGSHYTLDAVRILGIGQILLGLLATTFVAFGLVIWVIGFGVFNLIFGLYIYFNYERV
ncbi:MAG: hypothetical protein RL408_1038 [Bacteroidota bacterium]|jgi:hypothetical protein